MNNTMQLSSKLSNAANDIAKLSQKVTSLERESKVLSSSLSAEINTRATLEKHSKSSTDALSSKIATVKNDLDSLSGIVTDSIDKFKADGFKQMASKQQSIQSTVEAKLKRLEDFDKQFADSNYRLDSIKNETSQKLSSIEKAVDAQLKAFKEDLNTNLVHIEFIEKKLNDNYSIIKADISSIAKEVVQLKNEVVALKQFKASSIDATQSMRNSLITQEETMSKFTNRVSTIATELKNKLLAFDNSFNCQRNGFATLKEEVDKQLSGLDQALNEKINQMGKELNRHKGDVCREIEAFEEHVLKEHEKFTAYIQEGFEYHTATTKKMYDYLSIDVDRLKENQSTLNENIQAAKGDFFNNLNEVEEFLIKKYESLFKLVNNENHRMALANI